jgi:hypothetical protein
MDETEKVHWKLEAPEGAKGCRKGGKAKGSALEGGALPEPGSYRPPKR